MFFWRLHPALVKSFSDIANIFSKILDYEQSLFFLCPSSKKPKPRAWLKARDGRFLAFRGFATQRSRAHALPLLNLKKKRGCSQSTKLSLKTALLRWPWWVISWFVSAGKRLVNRYPGPRGFSWFFFAKEIKSKPRSGDESRKRRGERKKTSGYLGLESHFHADDSCQTRQIANKKSDQ